MQVGTKVLVVHSGFYGHSLEYESTIVEVTKRFVKDALGNKWQPDSNWDGHWRRYPKPNHVSNQWMEEKTATRAREFKNKRDTNEESMKLTLRLERVLASLRRREMSLQKIRKLTAALDEHKIGFAFDLKKTDE